MLKNNSSKMMKKCILTCAIAGFTVISILLTSCKEAGNSSPDQKPNILFILTDDQRGDALGAMGNRSIETPHIDQLAAKGVLFKNAHIMGGNHGAVCAPSRAMLMSGLGLNHVYEELGEITEEEWKTEEIGKFRPFGKALDDKLILPQIFRENGYTTFGTGKWHASRKSFTNGFDQGKGIFFGGMADHFKTPFTNMNEDGSFSQSERKGFSTDVITHATLEFLEGHPNGKSQHPFFAFVSYTAPHDPRSPAPEYIDYYDGQSLPVPSNLMDRHPFNLEGGSVTEKRPAMTIRDEQTGAWPRTPEHIRQQLADYYGLITHIDEGIGRMIDRLEELNLLENTIVVFTSDNGLALGSHGLLGKQSLYEHATHVPLIFAGPGIPEDQQKESLASLLDIYPTLCSLTGIDSPAEMDGKNLTPVIKGDQDSVRSHLFTIYWDFARAVRTQRWKLITYPLIHHTQLFDLQKDPWELNNLAQRTEYREKVNEMMELLKTSKKEADDYFPLFTEEKWPMEYSLEGFERKHDFHQPPYVRRKYFNEK